MKAILIALLICITTSQRGYVYMCHDDDFKDEQCMKTEILGENTFVWVRKCKGAKVCVGLPYYGNIGACSIKVRSHYDGEACANGNKCTSGICDGTKCKGLNPNIKCQRGLGQCKKGYLCRQLSATNTETFCQQPIDKDKECGDYEGSDGMNGRGFLFSSRYFNPANNPCKLGYVCSTTKSSTTRICTEIGSQEKDSDVTNPLACKTGVMKSGKCWELPGNNTACSTTEPKAYGSTQYTSKGGEYCLSNDISTEFGLWLKEIGDNKLKDEDANYEAYRYTRNKKKINEAFFRYSHYGWISDADECAYDYMWKSNNGNYLKLSFMLLVLLLIL